MATADALSVHRGLRLWHYITADKGVRDCGVRLRSEALVAQASVSFVGFNPRKARASILLQLSSSNPAP